MSWADPVIATALAAVAERTAPTTLVATVTSWNPYEVWLARARPPRELAPLPAPGNYPSSGLKRY